MAGERKGSEPLSSYEGSWCSVGIWDFRRFGRWMFAPGQPRSPRLLL